MTLGVTTSTPVVMQPSELARLIGFVFRDNSKLDCLAQGFPRIIRQITPEGDYYDTPESWFTENIMLESHDHIKLMRLGSTQISDFYSYLKCLCELHKRRRKFSIILSRQSIPSIVQIAPRVLLEYGHRDPRALASWLVWRKFFYDVDNRSAQETGYLFEPILAEAIGEYQRVRRTGSSHGQLIGPKDDKLIAGRSGQMDNP